jgi:hypothetical protein
MMELELDIRGLMKLVCLALYEAQARARKRMLFSWLVSFLVLQGRFGLLPLFYLLFLLLLLLSPAPNHKLRFFFSNL